MYIQAVHAKNTTLLCSHSPARRYSYSSRRPRILLVEDSQIIQCSMKILLKELNCRVTLASCGEEALAVFPDGFDLILLDIGLPDINGFIVAKDIRTCGLANGKTIPIIGHTAYSISSVIDRCYTAGMNTAYKKFTSVNELYEMLRRWLPSEFHPGLKKKEEINSQQKPEND